MVFRAGAVCVSCLYVLYEYTEREGAANSTQLYCKSEVAS